VTTQRDIIWPPEDQLEREIRISRLDAEARARRRRAHNRREGIPALIFILGLFAFVFLCLWAGWG